MANLAALDLAKLLPWASLKVYTVGAPRVGNHAFAKQYNSLVADSWAIINYRVSHHRLQGQPSTPAGLIVSQHTSSILDPLHTLGQGSPQHAA